MNSKEYMEAVKRTKSEQVWNLAPDVIHSLFGLTTEVGELVDAFKKHSFYGKPMSATNIEEELGDIMWYMAVLCSYYGFDFETIMQKNIDKLKVRYPHKFTSEKALNRDLDAEDKVLKKIPVKEWPTTSHD